MDLVEYIATSLRTRRLVARRARVLVAVSGGLDSMVLLHLLQTLASRFGWRLTVAHFNHQLRGRSSDADERLVRATAKILRLPFVAGRDDVRGFARANALSIEMAARRLRHGFFAATARRRKISVVALAHHADDQVELFFVRLLRGSGGEGLAGMKWVSPSPADARIRLVRPLLDIAKADLTGFARAKKIAFREDASNASPDFLRNRIRGELLPLLREKYQPALNRAVLRTMEIVRAEAEVVGGAARRVGRNFAGQSVAVQRRRLQQQLIEQGIAPEFELVELLRREADCAVMISPQVRVARDAAGRVRAEMVHRDSAFEAAPVKKVDLQTASKAVFGGAKISWSIKRQKNFTRPRPVAGREIFDADKVGRRIVLRHWRAGDRFQPSGMVPPVKLQDLFVNLKIPQTRRGGLVVATTAGGEIFWVEGLRIGERFKLAEKTQQQLWWRWQRPQ